MDIFQKYNCKSGTVYQRAGRYYVSILCEVKEVKPNSILNAVGIGIDLGIKDFAVRSDGKTHKNINKTVQVKKIEKRLKREQRSLSRKFENIRKRGEQPVTNKRANINKNILRVQQLHARLANIRLAYVKSIVNDVVKTKPMFITVEDLNVKGMMKNKHLSKAVAQQCFMLLKHGYQRNVGNMELNYGKWTDSIHLLKYVHVAVKKVGFKAV